MNTITFDQYKNQFDGKRVRETAALGYQCVAQAKHFARLVHGRTLKNFSGSALRGWQSGSPFVGLPYVRIPYQKGMIPPRGAIVFFDKTPKNPHGHVAITGTSQEDFMYVMEQNGGRGSGDGLRDDAIRIVTRKYQGDSIGNCLGWFVLYVPF